MFEALYVASNVRNLDMDKANAKEKSFVSSVRRRARVGLSALLSHGMSVWASTEVKKSFGHACVWLLSSRIKLPNLHQGQHMLQILC
jgi:hypothetical protein